MSDQDLVVETVRDILAGYPPFAPAPERPWDDGLWGTLADAGLTGVGLPESPRGDDVLWAPVAEAGLPGVGLPESSGGSGGDFADAVAIVRTLAAGAAAVPVAEQLLVAGPAVVAADL